MWLRWRAATDARPLQTKPQPVLHALAETGIAGLAAQLFLFAAICIAGWQRRRRREGRILLGATAIMLAAGLTDVPFYDSEIVQMYMTLVGAVLAATADKRATA